MTRRIISFCILSFLLCFFYGCGKQNTVDYSSWLPDESEINNVENNQDNKLLNNSNDDIKFITDESSATGYYTTEYLVDALLNEDSAKLADGLWQNQISNGIYSVTDDELNQNMLTFYVSTSEGDDNNLGLSPSEPKKTFSQFSEIANITVLLKCGDVFELDKTFKVGSGCIYATYGQGPRPVVSFYEKLEVEFTQLPEYENVWKASLQDLPRIYNTYENKDNCNIGQLVINGVVNWKRVVVSSSEAKTFDFPGSLVERADGSWTVDWLQSLLYVYSESNPNEQEIYAAPDGHGIVFNKTRNTVLKGWEIVGAGAHGCNIVDGEDVSITNCYFHNIGGSIHLSAGIRYGNAVQVWDGGINVTVQYNYADWVFDSCYTNQGSSSSCYGENIIFANNIGGHSFTGIETWGDRYSDIPFNNIVYRDNIIFHMCDITDPDKHMFSSSNGKLIAKLPEEPKYVSYRGGYTYNQMTCLNTSNSWENGELKILNNVFWNTNRLLILISDITYGYPDMNNNLFYSETTSEDACLFRYTDDSDTICYVNSLAVPGNKESICLINSGYDITSDLNRLKENMKKIIEKSD